MGGCPLNPHLVDVIPDVIVLDLITINLECKHVDCSACNMLLLAVGNEHHINNSIARDTMHVCLVQSHFFLCKLELKLS